MPFLFVCFVLYDLFVYEDIQSNSNHWQTKMCTTVIMCPFHEKKRKNVDAGKILISGKTLSFKDRLT